MNSLQTCPPHHLIICSHFSLGNPQKSFFNIVIHILQIIYVTVEDNKLQPINFVTLTRVTNDK